MAHACPDKWLTPHRTGGSAAPEYSRNFLLQIEIQIPFIYRTLYIIYNMKAIHLLFDLRIPSKNYNYLYTTSDCRNILSFNRDITLSTVAK